MGIRWGLMTHRSALSSYLGSAAGRVKIKMDNFPAQTEAISYKIYLVNTDHLGTSKRWKYVKCVTSDSSIYLSWKMLD